MFGNVCSANVCSLYIMQVITYHLLLSNNRGQMGGYVSRETRTTVRKTPRAIPIPPNVYAIPPNQIQPSKMAQPSHFQPITPLIILLLFTLIKHHLFVINLSTTTNSYLSTLNINFLLYITKFISLSTSLLLINYYVQQGRGGSR